MDDQEAEVMKNYLALCSNPLRGDDQLLAEYEELKQNPRVKIIAFYRADIMMVGTDEIVVTVGGTKYCIGEFIIFLIRKKDKGYWKVDFRFQNATHAQHTYDMSGQLITNTYHHPHIMDMKCGIIDAPSGRLCINKGQFSVYQHMRKGEMHSATSCLIEILETYPTGNPYRAATSWPEWRGGRTDGHH